MALLDRVQAVLLKPQQAWPAISAEPDTTQNILTSYVVPLSVFRAICPVVGLAIFGVTLPFIGHLAYGPVFLILTLITGFIVSVATVYVLAQIIDALAPTFGTQKNPVQAMKVAAYSFTPVAAGAVFSLFPLLGILGVLTGLYAIYELYLGLRSTMGTAPDKAVGYTAVVSIVTIIVVAIIGVIFGLLTAGFAPHVPTTTYGTHY